MTAGALASRSACAASPVEAGRAAIAASSERVDLWWCRPADLSDPERAATCEAWLSADERARQRRLQTEALRRERLASCALVRSALSLYADIAPAAWRFRAEAHGRPELMPQPGVPALSFNLSNTAGLVVCAVTAAGDVGVDVEDTTRRADSLRLARRFFSPEEAAALEALEPAARAERFFELWTLKEAYSKARGLGLSIPLSRHAFHRDAGREIRIAFSPEIDDDPQAWQLRSLRLLDRFCVALAVRCERTRALSVRTAPLVPGREALALP